MLEDEKSTAAREGAQIVVRDNKLLIPDNPVLCYIEGDGVGPEIANVTRDLIDASVGKAYRGTKKIVWLKMYAGETSQSRFGSPLPQRPSIPLSSTGYVSRDHSQHPWEGDTGVSM